MTAVSVIGAEKKTVELPDEIFAAKVNVPLCVGAPEIAPVVALSERPGGSPVAP